MPLYATKGPTKLSCGRVARTLQELGIWRPIENFSEFVFWGSTPRPLQRQSPPGDCSKTMVFLLREEAGISKTMESMTFLKRIVAGAMEMIFQLRELYR